MSSVPDLKRNHPPQIVEICKRYQPGAYGYTVAIGYNMFFISVLLDRKHPLGDKLSAINDARKNALTQLMGIPLDDPEWEFPRQLKRKIAEEISDFFAKDQYLAMQILDHGNNIIKQHTDALRPYGKFPLIEADGFYFTPDAKYIKELEEKRYYCPNIRNPYSCSYDRRFSCFIMFNNHSTYLLKQENGIVDPRPETSGLSEKQKNELTAMILAEKIPIHVLDKRVLLDCVFK